jgi:hypothetical protein
MKHYLLSTYYRAKTEERQEEYDFCIRKNQVAGFDRIYLLVENDDDLQLAAEKFSEVGGVSVYNISKRPTFRDFFDFLSSRSGFSDSINVVANTDIFFANMQEIDRNLSRLQKGKSCFALTRYDFHLHRPSHLYDVPDSQDTWVFNGTEKLNTVQNIDFTMGVAGCDNRLAHELSVAGFEVLNPSKKIITFHYHESPLRTNADASGQQIVRIPPPYLLLPPTE